MAKYEFDVPADADGLRLDQCLARCVEPLSRSTARVALDLGAVFVDERRVKVASRKVAAGQHVVVHLGGAFDRAHKQVGRAARARDEAHLPAFRVLFEDEHLVAVHKPAGLLSAPTPEGDSGNLQMQLSRRGGEVFVVHRLDLQTSGVLVYAKTKASNHALSELFRTHDLVRRYDVFAAGAPRDELFSVRQSLSGKPAVTHFRRLVQHAAFCHLEATLETGRTHQIRRHLLSVRLPVLADNEYSRREPWHPPRLGLHAKHLGLVHPVTGAPLAFDVELPDDLAGWLRAATSAGVDDPAEPSPK
ncbi:MAG TPA: RluA family pseudouridine synthase [Polyangiaceae bacterium]|nr:RluA family pseudouridine synthase [Polyangiaceae bacterium]